MFESENQLKKFIKEIEEREILEERYSLSIVKETNIHFLFFKQELEYVEYLYRTLGYNYRYYFPSLMD